MARIRASTASQRPKRSLCRCHPRYHLGRMASASVHHRRHTAEQHVVSALHDRCRCALGSHDLGIQGDRWQHSRCCADSLDLQHMHRYGADAARVGLGRSSCDRRSGGGRNLGSWTFPIRRVRRRYLSSCKHLIGLASRDALPASAVPMSLRRTGDERSCEKISMSDLASAPNANMRVLDKSCGSEKTQNPS